MRRSTVALTLGIALAGCSLKRTQDPNSLEIRIADARPATSQVWSRLIGEGIHAFGAFSAPTSVSDFSCYVVNVTGTGVPTSMGSLTSCKSPDNMKGRGFGILTKPVPSGSSATASVPRGPGRVFDVYGIYPKTGLVECGGSPASYLGGGGGYFLGSTAADLSGASATVTVPVSFSTGALASLKCDLAGIPGLGPSVVTLAPALPSIAMTVPSAAGPLPLTHPSIPVDTGSIAPLDGSLLVSTVTGTPTLPSQSGASGGTPFAAPNASALPQASQAASLNFVIGADLSPDADAVCQVLSPYATASASCSIAAFSVGRAAKTAQAKRAAKGGKDVRARNATGSVTLAPADVTSNGNFQVRACAQNGEPADCATSPPIPVTRWFTRQMGDISGDNNAPEDIRMGPAFNGKVYFTAKLPGYRSKIFRTDGSGSIEQFSDISTGSDCPASSECKMEVLGGKLYFTAQDDAYRLKLYRTDGTTIWQVSDTNPGGSDSVYELVSDGSSLYFPAQVASGGRKLFKYDPAAHKTYQLADINGVGYEDDPQAIHVFGSEIWFIARMGGGGGGRKLFRLSGSSLAWVGNFNGNVSIDDFPSNNNRLESAGGAVYATGFNDYGANKLYRVDMSTLAVTRVSNLRSDPYDDIPSGEKIVSYGGYAYFIGTPAPGVTKVYRTNGATVEQLTEFGGPGIDDSVEDLGALPAVGVVFLAKVPGNSGRKLYWHNGTTLRQFTDLTGDPATVDEIISYSKHPNSATKFLFVGRAADGHFRLFEGNPSSGVLQLAQLRPGEDDFMYGQDIQVGSVGNHLYFPALGIPGASGDKLYRLCSSLDAGCTP